jgi:phosphomannomutase
VLPEHKSAPVVRVMVESDQESLSRRCAESIAEAIRKAA